MTMQVYAPNPPDDVTPQQFEERVDLRKVETLELHPKLARTKPWAKLLATLSGVEVRETEGVAMWAVHYAVKQRPQSMTEPPVFAAKSPRDGVSGGDAVSDVGGEAERPVLETMRFKPDASTRRRFFPTDSFSHPAKMHCGLLMEIAARYDIQPGSLVVDPMAGSGTSLLLAQLGINVVAIELETHFVQPMEKAWLKIQRHGPQMGYEMGEVTILQGDARNLGDLLADAAVFSPPFQDQKAAQDARWLEEHAHEITSGGKAGVQFGPAMKQGYTRPDAAVDSVITSPPFENSVEETKPNTSRGLRTRLMMQERSHLPSQAGGQGQGYTRPDAAVDSVITSPPYEEAQSGGGISAVMRGEGSYQMTTRVPGSVYQPASHGKALENIGNQRGSQYWESMFSVYSECLRILRPGGVMVLVLKGFTRDGQYIDLPQQTAEMCEALGFKLFDRWARELWSLSFWRILQKRKNPDAFDDRLNYEEVLAFRKGEDGGGTVDSVVTSPPYEGFTEPNDEQRTHAAKGLKFESRVGYTRKGVDVVLTSPPYEGSIQGEPGIDWTKAMGGKRDMTIEPAQATRVASLSGYARRNRDDDRDDASDG